MHQSDIGLGPIPSCQHCYRQKGQGSHAKSHAEFERWLEEDYWGPTVGLTLPLAQHYNPADWCQPNPPTLQDL